MRRYGFIAIIILFIVALSGFYIYLKRQQSPLSSPMHTIPINASLIIEVKKPLKVFDDLLNENEFYKALSNFNGLPKLHQKLSTIDSVINNSSLKNILSHKELIFSLHELGNKQTEVLLVCGLSGRLEGNKLIHEIEAILPQPEQLETKRYNQVKTLAYTHKNTNFYFCYTNGVFILSPSEMLLQDAIRQSESETSILNDKGFGTLLETAGQHADANLYIQFKHFTGFLKKYLSNNYLEELGIAEFAQWCELDLNLKKRTILLNGFSVANTSDKMFTRLFKHQDAQNFKFIKFIPAGIEGFSGFGLSNLNAYRLQLAAYMENVGERERFEVNENQIRNYFGDRAFTQLQEVFKNELAQIALADGTQLFMIRTSGYRDANDVLAKYFNHYTSENRVKISDLKQEFSIDAETSFPIYKMPLSYFPTRAFGPWFKAVTANYVSVFDDYIIFGDTYSGVSRFIYNNILQKTLAFDGEYQQFSNYLSNKSNFYLYINFAGTGKVIEGLLDKEAEGFFKANQKAIRAFYGFGWQFIVEDDLYFNNVLFRHQPSNKMKAATEWETRLDTLIAFKPELVTNHYTNNKEIFVQDMNHNVYLINHSGRILWKVQLDEPIMGKVEQVDYYKNGKLQLLFNTKTKLHLLDRNGNYVERYPVKIKNQAIMPISVFDYDNRKNYRVFVACQNNQVYAYNIEGRIVSGFDFSGTDHEIIAPVQYFRANQKDYIVVTDKSRIYILSRRGNERVKLKQQFDASPNNEFAFQPESSGRPARLVRTDVEGNIYFVYFTGEVQKKSVGKFSAQHYFDIYDITGNRVADYIFVDNKKLQVFSLTGDEQFSHEFSTPIVHKPAIYKFSSTNQAVGITEKQARKIYLFNKHGQIMSGFPLPGKTRFSIGVLEPGSGRFNLVVGGDNQYLYNYKLN